MRQRTHCARHSLPQLRTSVLKFSWRVLATRG